MTSKNLPWSLQTTDQTMENSFTVGSWNVHNFVDSGSKPNIYRISEALKKTPVDIIGMQEVSEYSYIHKKLSMNSMEIIQTQCNFNYVSKLLPARYIGGVCLQSKFKLLKCVIDSPRVQLNIIQLPFISHHSSSTETDASDINWAKMINILSNIRNDTQTENQRIEYNYMNNEEDYSTQDTKSNTEYLNMIENSKYIIIGVLVVHLNYKSEKKRILEFANAMEMVSKEFSFLSKILSNKHLPIMILGDMNALKRLDYNENEWNDITHIRRENKWELPQTKLVSNIICNCEYFYDSLYLYRDFKAIGSQRNSNQILSNRKKFKKKKKLKAKFIRNKNTNNLNGELWRNIIEDGTLSTCRYDTRIDYVFVNRGMLLYFDVVKYQHLEHQNCSDHKLIRVKFKLKENCE